HAPLSLWAVAHASPTPPPTTARAPAVAFGRLGARVVPPLAAAMCVSRLVAGVHYPSDVVAGVVLGALTAWLGVQGTETGHG
ncbi:phosphatase PAP2 family protein, partial [Streptomyces sp. NPDC059466]|uniref:phosphatase PAP2 family protein n=1 Tax=Streptomyces sp. NPDC059466 TaxID=3346843 RepID=UPI0036C091E9